MTNDSKDLFYRRSLYGVYDRIAMEIVMVSISSNDASAWRAYTQSMQDNPHWQDYSLMHLGSINMITGHIKSSPEDLRTVLGARGEPLENQGDPIKTGLLHA